MKKNILIIDDSALMRRVLSDIINSDERFYVLDRAVNGLEGLDLIVKNHTKYDAIVLDINMPKMNGIEFLEQMVKNNIKIIVIVVSTVAKKGAKETIRALELGAFDFVTKPESFIEVKSNIFKEKLIECLGVATKAKVATTEALCEKPLNIITRTSNIQNSSKSIRPHQKVEKIGANKLVALACSTGGPRALQSVIPKLSSEINASVLVVQHMPEGFTNSLAQRLNEISAVTVKEAQHGDIIQKGVVYIAKGGSQMRLLTQSNGEYKLSITAEAPRNGLKPCADILFESLLDTNYDQITCVVLTGMGGDGTKGIKQLNEVKDIYVIAQDEATCTVYGMPKVLTEAGLTDVVVSLDRVAETIMKNVGVR